MALDSSLEPEGAQLVARGQEWVATNGRLLIGAVAALAVIGGGAFFYNRNRAAQEDLAAGRLAEASVYFWQGDYTRSLELSKQVYAQYGGTPSGVDAHRLAGDNAFWNGDFKTAVAEYRLYVDKVDQGLLADAARRSLAYALESDKQPAEAVKIYDMLVGRFDRASSAEFLVAAARCLRATGKPDEAIKRLQRVDDEFGDTSYAQAARVDLGELRAAAAP